MSVWDRTFVGVGSVLVLASVALAVLPAPAADAGGRAQRLPPIDTGRAEAYTTAALPAGARVDPETLELVGLDLTADEGSVVVPWSLLRGYEYQDDLRGLPTSIRALDGQRVLMAGFLLPHYEYDDIREFHLVASHWSCCFGVPTGLAGWIAVDLAAGQKGLPNTVDPITVEGTFRVREQKEAGYVVTIYGIEDAEAAVLR